MTLSAKLAAVLFALVVPSEQWAADPAQVPVVADDIALAAGMRGGSPFTGPNATELLALAAAAVAVHESNLAARVIACEVNGDEGRSVTAFQLMRGVAWGGHTREEICPSGPLAAYLAVGILQAHAARCARTPIEMFRGYASGSCAKKSAAAERQCRKWVRAAKLAGHEVACETPFARLPFSSHR
jgi:hypothetical protein